MASSPSPSPTPMHEFLVFFVHRHFNFRYPELAAVLTLQGLRLEDVITEPSVDALPDPESSPLLRIRLPSEAHAKFLSTRGILIKGVYQVWGHTASDQYSALVESVSANVRSSSQHQQLLQDDQCSWCINVDAFGKKLTMAEQEIRREHFRDVLPFAGPVNVRAPHEKFLVLEEFGLELADLKTAKPSQLFLLREIAGSERNRGRGGARDLVDQQTLKKRAYIGPTSMESEMALLMSNMGLVDKGDLVIDPFVGTGSVLVPCATHGAVCFGTDIDIRVLLGIGVGVSGAGALEMEQAALAEAAAAESQEAGDATATATRINVVSNFKQYGLALPELIRADNSMSPLVTKCANYFDAVVCDPPYGIRAGARKSGRKPGSALAMQSEQQVTKRAKQFAYIPPTQPYAAEDVMHDLLAFAAKTLRMGGRLVYLLPTTYEYTDADLPQHPQLRVLFNSEQKLTKKYARRLITMVKVDERASSVAGAAGSTTTSDSLTTSASINTTSDQKQVDEDVSYANLREKILAENRKRKMNQFVKE